MNLSFTLADPRAADDLDLFLARAARIEDGSVRLVAGGGVLAAYVAALFPAGLSDEMPTVLGLRVLRMLDADGFDVVVSLAALRESLDHARQGGAEAAEQSAATGLVVAVPPEAPGVVWAAISPPRYGWQRQAPVGAVLIEEAARAGISEVAAAVPDAAGELIVRRVRSEVWGRPLAGAEQLPAGAAFAALSLGFLGQGLGDAAEQLDHYRSGGWARLSSARGHILARSRNRLPGL